MKNKDKYPDIEKAKDAYDFEMNNPFTIYGPYCDFETWLEREEYRDEIKEDQTTLIQDDMSNVWDFLRGIDISLRRIADMLEELNERIER